MPRTIQELLDQQDELADKFENCDPELGQERPIEDRKVHRKKPPRQSGDTTDAELVERWERWLTRAYNEVVVLRD